MKYRSKKILLSTFGEIVDSDSVQRIGKLNAKRYTLYAKPAFSLAEVVAALVILAFVSTSVLVVINRYMASAADSVLRMQAFEIARENMEKLLTSVSVTELVEYGNSEKYPDIRWQTTVETFYEPITSRMWVQAICSADYTDSEDEVQMVELTHWLTSVTKAQVLQLLEQKQQEQEQLASQVIGTLEEAAEYAGVDEQIIQQWVENGMLKTEDGYYIKNQLDLYRDSDGSPTIEDRMLQEKVDAELIRPTKKPDEQVLRAEQDKRRQPPGKPGGRRDRQPEQDKRRQPPGKPGEGLIRGRNPEEVDIKELFEILSRNR